MRFALVGDHPDGLDLARAVVESGRHELAVYSGGALGMEHLRRWQLAPARVGDLEEVLANPEIDAVIVAGSPANRLNQLRRALQSEHHVLCVHPLEVDGAYEAAMLQADARTVLLPLLPETLHPAIRRLADLMRSAEETPKGPADSTAISESPVASSQSTTSSASSTAFDLLDVELWTTEAGFSEEHRGVEQPDLPGWNIARFLGGEIAEVFGLAEGEEIVAGQLVLVSGRFMSGGMFRAAYLPQQSETRWRWTILKRYRRFDLVFPQGWPGPSRLTWTDDAGLPHEEEWNTWNPWPAMVEAFEAALGRFSSESIVDQAKRRPPRARPDATALPLQWQDEVRCLELNDAAHRSVERRRASTLDFQEASEEVGFKGTMTLVGCSLIWLSLALLIFSIWIPWLGWLIPPVFAIFLLLQLFRWVVPQADGKPNK